MRPRFECKFTIQSDQVPTLRDLIVGLFQKDAHAGWMQRQYPILSIYYDTRDLRFLYEKINGEFEHTKVRVRRYCRDFHHADSSIFLEAKIKDNNAQLKPRINLTQAGISSTAALNPLNWYRLEDPAIESIVARVGHLELMTTCGIYYEREAYEGMFSGHKVRLNFDTNITVLLPHELVVTNAIIESRRILPLNNIILEIKTDTPLLPKPLVNLLSFFRVTENRFSKYGEGMLFVDNQFNTMEIVA